MKRTRLQKAKDLLAQAEKLRHRLEEMETEAKLDKDWPLLGSLSSIRKSLEHSIIGTDETELSGLVNALYNRDYE